MLSRVLYGDVTLFNLLTAVLIIFITGVMLKIITLNLRRHLKDTIDKSHLTLIIKLVKYTVVTVAIVSALPYLGINLSGLIVAGGITGLVIGFASQKIVSNLISGIFLMIERPIKIGQQINVDGVAGYVEDIHMFSTIIRTYDGLYVRVPNEKVFTSNIINYVANVVRRFEYVVGIRYSDDADRAIEIIKKIIDDHPLALKNPSPQAFVENLGDNAVNILVRIWGPATEWYSTKMELLWKIKRTLEENGIEIAFPQRTLWFADDLNAAKANTGDPVEQP
ncbi:mechanosensitive ion channel family protein [bacterium]|nr:mechanosensitive ion channel family protein [bacterium]